MGFARDPLVLPCAAFLCGIVIARYTVFDVLELTVAIAALLLLWVIARLRARRVGVFPRLAALLLAGCAVAEYRRLSPGPELTEDDDKVLIVGGGVVEPPSAMASITRFVVELEPGARVRVSLTPRDEESLPTLRYGDVVEVEARVRKPVNFRNDGAFDFASYLARQDIYWTASARGVGKLRVLPGRCGVAWRAVWFTAREWALKRVERLFGGDTQTAAIMAGMLLGDAAAIERSWTEDFRRTGTYHTLVISGLHITVLAGALLTFLRLCFVPLGPRLVIAAAAAWGYALLTGMQTPVARSAAGFTLFLVASYFYRRGRVLNLLAAVALVFIIADPDQIADASFHLSFLAVAAIGGIALPLIERTSAPVFAAARGLAHENRDAAMPAGVAALRVELRLMAETVALCTRLPAAVSRSGVAAAVKTFAHVYDLVLVSAAVQLALVLPSIAYFHRLSLTSLTANAFAVPVLSAAVPFGFFAILTGWSLPASVSAWLLAISRSVVSWHSRIEPAWRIPDLPFELQIAIAVALIVVSAGAYYAVRYRLVIVAGCLALVALAYVHPFAYDRRAGRLEMTTVDVGQGDSHLVVTPTGKTLLVDGGGIPSFDPRFKPKLEIGEDVVSPYLWSRGIRRIDAVALTHGHDDHARGLLAIIENFRPRELWTGAQPVSGIWLQLERAAREFGVNIVYRCSGSAWDWGGVSMRVLAPSPGRPPTAGPHNNDSMVLQLTYGKHTFLLTGDIERAIENELLASGALSRIDVLKVAHHGSRTSTTPAFLKSLRPGFAIVSAGRYNSYRHPHADVIERLQSAQTRVLRTDRDGSITLESDGKRLYLDTHRFHRRGSGLRHPLAGE